jgi:hypothetical protein
MCARTHTYHTRAHTALRTRTCRNGAQRLAPLVSAAGRVRVEVERVAVPPVASARHIIPAPALDIVPSGGCGRGLALRFADDHVRADGARVAAQRAPCEPRRRRRRLFCRWGTRRGFRRWPSKGRCDRHGASAGYVADLGVAGAENRGINAVAAGSEPEVAGAPCAAP